MTGKNSESCRRKGHCGGDRNLRQLSQLCLKKSDTRDFFVCGVETAELSSQSNCGSKFQEKKREWGNFVFQ